jgi:hypothetical protein
LPVDISDVQLAIGDQDQVLPRARPIICVGSDRTVESLEVIGPCAEPGGQVLTPPVRLSDVIPADWCGTEFLYPFNAVTENEYRELVLSPSQLPHSSCRQERLEKRKSFVTNAVLISLAAYVLGRVSSLKAGGYVEQDDPVVFG